jgi:protein gp37
MSAVTGIEWTDRTWNPVTGCTKVSPGCAHCYAEGVADRFWATQYVNPWPMAASSRPRQFTDVYCHEDRLLEPLSWRKPARVFVNSMSDLFHEDVPDAFIDKVFAVMALAPRHTFQILTKRPERMLRYCTSIGFDDGEFEPDLDGEAMRDAMIEGAAQSIYARLHPREDPSHWLAVHQPLTNVWLGVSVENQHFADERIPLLIKTPAAVRFVSYEPALGPVDFSPWIGGRRGCAEEHRGRSVSGGGVRSAEDRRARPDLADQAEAEASGEAGRRLPAGSGDDEGHQAPRAGALLGVAAFQGADSGRDDRQSRERPQTAEPSRQPDAGDEFGAGGSCADRSREVPTGRRTEQSGEAHASLRRGDSATPSSGRAAEVDCGIVQRERQNHLQDRSRPTLDWIICGGESGPGARPFDLAWARSIVAQCQAAGVPVFVKQLGKHPTCDHCGDAAAVFGVKHPKGGDITEFPADLQVREFPA